MQTSVTPMAKAFAGMIGDARRRKVISAVNEEATAEIRYGVMVKSGTSIASALLMTPVLIAQVIADTVFTAANATETFTAAAHGFVTGDGPVQVSNAGGALPTGLTAATDYWIIRVTANTFKLATSLANALAGTNLLISTDGTGVQTLADVASTTRVTTYTLKGVLAHDHAQAKPEELGDTGLKPKARLGLMSIGAVWVICEQLPTKLDDVHVRAAVGAFGGQIAGAFRTLPDAGTTYEISSLAKWTGRTDTTTTALIFADATFTVANATDTATITAHGLQTGDGPFQVSNSGGGLPTGLTAATNYWVFVTGANTFKFATSFANALIGTVVNLTGDGTGTQTMVDVLGTTVRSSIIAEVVLDMTNAALAVASA
jgi:hypothetical protein